MRRLPGRPHLPRPRVSRRAVAGALLVAVLLVPGWLWLRDSSLVSVDDVTITGVSGPQAGQVRQALEDAARDMTTLDVDTARLREAVRQIPVVASVTAEARPLHRLDIVVRQHTAVAALANGDRRMAVAGDGTILEGTLTKDLPLVPVTSPPGGRMLVEPKARQMVALLGAAPPQMLSRISTVELGDRGLLAHVDRGPDVYFGPASRLGAKWAAAVRVLADASARGATYLDVRVPERPAAGGLAPESAAAAPSNTQSGIETSQ
jgi:cell division protein FtsQ